ncbi:MAG: biopolymer transporter ExbD [Cyanobacteria bacterium NC_groundwater_1444_Ag_S-0.65um_54_12]|nr:biopolymer transporter ExbD [Cyanobacteria bacterium NC_groundwater_1444_Ag_S-0.65um_54_12]
MRSASDEDAIVDINVTPLVDVALVLLIIFLATSYLIAQQSLKVELPKAARTTATEARTIGVVVKADGRILLDGASIEPAALVEELAARQATRPNISVLIGADRQVPHGRVVEVMDAVRIAGIERLAFAVERK